MKSKSYYFENIKVQVISVWNVPKNPEKNGGFEGGYSQKNSHWPTFEGGYSQRGVLRVNTPDKENFYFFEEGRNNLPHDKENIYVFF